MNVVLDTNVLLIAIPSHSTYHDIIKAFKKRLFRLIITPQVFLEYEEILTNKANVIVANSILSAFLEADNIVWTEIYYYWDLISADPDDNKFTDAYINGSGDYLVTNDNHFNPLKALTFPPINIISANDFLRLIRSLPGF